MVGGSAVSDSRLVVLALPRLLGARGRVDPGVAEHRMGRLGEAPSRSLERRGAPRGGACGGLLRVFPDDVRAWAFGLVRRCSLLCPPSRHDRRRGAVFVARARSAGCGWAADRQTSELVGLGGDSLWGSVSGSHLLCDSHSGQCVLRLGLETSGRRTALCCLRRHRSL